MSWQIFWKEWILMKFFSVPADFQNTTIDRITQLNERYPGSKVVEVYGQITTGNLIHSGRAAQLLPETGFRELERYVKYCKEHHIEFSYTLNSSCLGNREFSEEGISEVYGLLENLSNIGVEILTIAMPPLFEVVQHSGFKFRTKASAICEINSVGKALFYKNIGAERMVIEPDTTRDFKKIKRICAAFGDGVEIIINSFCFRNCAYKMFHYNHESHCNQTNKNQALTNYYFHRCTMKKAEQLENIIKLNWIRPEDLRYYKEAGINYFKIQGRQSVMRGDLVKTIECYFKEDYDGNLHNLLTLFDTYNSFHPYIDNKKLDGFVQKFYEDPDFCEEDCTRCGYCDHYAKKSMDQEKTLELMSKALVFYRDYDEFVKLINEQKSLKPVKKLFSDDELDFDINLNL